MICLYLQSRLLWNCLWIFRLQRFVLSCFLFREMVRNGIPRVCFYFFHWIRSCFLILERFKDQWIRLLLFLKRILRLAYFFFPFFIKVVILFLSESFAPCYSQPFYCMADFKRKPDPTLVFKKKAKNPQTRKHFLRQLGPTLV